MPTNTKTDTGPVTLERLEQRVAKVWIVGTAPLIMHKWSEKAKLMLPGNPNAEAAINKGKKKGLHNPEVEAEESTYRLPDGRPGFPATGFKASIVSAYDLFSGMTKTSLKRLLYVEGEVSGTDQLVPIFCAHEPELREDVARIAKGGTMLVYRHQFFPWWAELSIRYIVSGISSNSIISLVDAGGFGGVGEWRPSSPLSSTGTYGTYHVMTPEEKEIYVG